MGKLYYTLNEATAHLGEDAVNLGERGLLPMAFRWPEANNTLKTGFAIEHMAPGYERVQFSYITQKEFCRVVNTARHDDKVIVRHTFVSLEDLVRADEIIERRDNSSSMAIAECMLKNGVPRRNTYMGLDDIYVTSEAMAAYEETAATPGAKVEAATTDTTTPSDDWKDKARAIADELFDRDTNIGCRDSLKGYSKRVMETMQERGIKGAHGIIDNPATIMREALQGKKWWANKSK